MPQQAMTNAQNPHAAETADTALPAEEDVAQAILTLAAQEAGKTIAPADAALALMGPAQWQRALPAVRRVAVRLALEGRLVIYRKGKPVDPQEFRGVYRLGLPRED
ncbi:MAG TPA: DUF3253 domain-containing protein [Xanthobacteraceae bacterium]|jgi:hypothetical protein|nr:DUF3253 domain-containing protein [Xanthobacteraceae bacterium]HQS48313.1 DUF3253 domain-containing protein [Xanthobacteraceae bacterium]